MIFPIRLIIVQRNYTYELFGFFTYTTVLFEQRVLNGICVENDHKCLKVDDRVEEAFYTGNDQSRKIIER